MARIDTSTEKVAVVGEDGSALGTVRVALAVPARATSAIVLAHGAGGTMESPLLVELGRRIAEDGAAAVRFNFLYAERKRKSPDRKAHLLACWRSVADWVQARLRPRALFLGGKSMGGRYASLLAAEGYDTAGLVFLGYPLHPPGRPNEPRTEHLALVSAPMLFVSGSRDALARIDLLAEAVAALGPRARLHVVDGGDHSFRVPRRMGRAEGEILDEVASVVLGWLREHRAR